MARGDFRASGETLLRLAVCAAGTGDQRRALVLYGAYRSWLEHNDQVPWASEEHQASRVLNDLLDHPEAAVDLASGRTLEMSEIIQLATGDQQVATSAP